MKRPETIKKPEGKLAVLLPGLGAVSTTLIAGVLLARQGLASPVGSLSQTGTIRLGKRTDNRTPRIKEFAPLAALDDIVFGSWDLFPDNARESAVHAQVLDSKHIAFTTDTQKKQVELAKADSRQLRLVGQTLPIGAGAAGTLLALVGVILVVRGRPHPETSESSQQPLTM